MKLNPDCIRDILLTIEEVATSDSFFQYVERDHEYQRLKDYTHDELLYHFRQCDLAGLIVAYQPYDCGHSVDIADLSPAGHEFLANIRSESVWGKTKEISKKLGVGSLRSLAEIAVSVVTEIVKAYLFPT